jgi:hypothetical protein
MSQTDKLMSKNGKVMSKKLLMGLTPVLAVAALAVMPVAAQAEPHWKRNGALLKEGQKVKTNSWGKLTFTSAIGEVKCKKLDAGDVENPPGGGPGVDHVVLFQLYECTSPACPTAISVKASGLPWPTELFIDGSGAIRDRIKGIIVTFTCPPTTIVFSGELTPLIKNGTSASKPPCDEFDAGSGALHSELAGEGIIRGCDKFLGFAEQEVITASNP